MTAARDVAAQRVKGRVVDDRASYGIADASVRLISERAQLVDSTVADSTGYFAFRGSVLAGRYHITVRRLGYYASLVDNVVVTASGPAAEMLVPMRRITLDTTRVTASRHERALGLNPRSLSIKPIDRAEIEATLDRVGSLMSLLRAHNVAGLWVDERTGCIRTRGGSPCALVVVDGVPRRESMPDLSPALIDYVLILRGTEATVLFGRQADGGAVLIYTLDGPPNR